ncbi:hypothetical protein [Actinoplanes regularis]|uniref:hypothetical protein n=1 Tax=Actinoplanes regularis TaxID=52697 RepID=UPI0024A3C94B|nr:hypothetical protein [Actinoplanes regularis]GLW35812.1 hypothetical protein Areg01_87470 [Actinoplanes regularis]
MIWQSFTTRRALTAEPVAFRWGSSGATSERRHAPLVVREPETAWWQAQVRSMVTVAEIGEYDAACHREDLMARLARLAEDDELLVVFGSDGRSAPQGLVAELRHRLPRHGVVAVAVRNGEKRLLRHAAAVERLLDGGGLPVVITPAVGLHEVTAGIASYLRADRVLRVLRSNGGADLCLVWQRGTEASLS